MNKYFILNILFPIFIGFAFTSCGKEDDEPDYTPPSSSSLSAPTGVSATVVSDGVKLSWKPVDGAEFYIVTRSNSIDATPVVLIYIGEVGEVYDTSVIDINPLDGDNYYYIQAGKKEGDSSSFSPKSAPIYVHYTRDANPPVGDEWIDPIFAQLLQRHGYISDAKTVTPYDVADISRLNLHGDTEPRLKSLRGLQYFISLTSLYCVCHELTDLDVSKNPQLLELYCSRNKLTSLNISKNTQLSHLDCNNNQLTDIDISNNTQLEELNCSLNKLDHIDFSNNSKLLRFNCSHNPLPDLYFPKNSSLQELMCYYNKLTKLDVSQIPSLRKLYCDHNQLTNLDTSKNTQLEYLDCKSNELTGLDISKNPQLRALSCSYNPGRNNEFIVNAWFDSTTIPSNFTLGSWNYNGEVVTIEYHIAE